MVRVPNAAGRLGAVIDPVIPLLGEWMGRRPEALSLAQGMVSWDPPPAVRLAALDALDQFGTSLHRYGPTWGEPALLEVVTRQLTSSNALDLEGAFPLVTTGSNMAFAAIAQVLCDPGSEVILPLPYYFNHGMAVQLAGGVVVPVEAGPIPDPEVLRAALSPRTRAIVTVSPNNPSGVVIPTEVLTAINHLCAERGLFHISDEAYEQFVHGEVPHFSPGSLPGASAHTISLYSLSKAYGMAGWRMGYAAVPKALRPALAKVLDTIQICPTGLSQRVAQAALSSDPSWVRAQVATLGPRRGQLLETVHQWQAEGWPVRLWAEPDGAFYGLLVMEGLLDLSGQPLDSHGLMRRLVLEEGVAALSGSAFGLQSPGTCVLRLSYGMLDGAQLAEALARLSRGLGRLWRAG
jgi:aspartate/methionine/tyrosine aminotransferase